MLLREAEVLHTIEQQTFASARQTLEGWVEIREPFVSSFVHAAEALNAQADLRREGQQSFFMDKPHDRKIPKGLVNVHITATNDASNPVTIG